jgi:hypothetical protein
MHVYDKDNIPVLAYAHFTVRKQGYTHRVPWKLYIIPIGLAISTPLFFLAWIVSASDYGTTVAGAKLKFVFWGIGLIIEVISHIRMSRRSWYKFRRNERSSHAEDKDIEAEPLSKLAQLSTKKAVTINRSQDLPVPSSNLDLSSRLEAITTIILGEVSQMSLDYKDNSRIYTNTFT